MCLCSFKCFSRNGPSMWDGSNSSPGSLLHVLQTPGVPVTTCQHEFPSRLQSLSGTLAILVLFCIIYILSILASCPAPRKGLTDMSNERINSVICKRQRGKHSFIARCFLRPAGPGPSSPVRFRSSHSHTFDTLYSSSSQGLCTHCSLSERVSMGFCLAGSSSLPRSLFRRHLCQAAFPGHSG